MDRFGMWVVFGRITVAADFFNFISYANPMKWRGEREVFWSVTDFTACVYFAPCNRLLPQFRTCKELAIFFARSRTT